MNLSLGCSQSIVHHNRCGRERKKIYKNQGQSQKTKVSRVVCPYCFIIIAPYDKQTTTSKGVAHYDCVITEVMEKLKIVGLPVPSVCTLGSGFQNYLTKQAEELSLQFPGDWEYKLAEIIKISEEIFFQPIDLSTLIARQSQI